LFLTKAETDFFEDFALFEEVGNVPAGSNFDGLFLGSGAGLVHEAGLFFDVGFDLVEFVLPVLMLGRREIMGVLTVVLKQVVAITVI
jgi:hypothetical protein